MGSSHGAVPMGPGLGMTHGHGTEHWGQAWKHPVGTSCGIQPRGQSLGVLHGPWPKGAWDKGSQAEGQGYHSLPHSQCCPRTPKNYGNIMVEVLGSAGGCTLCSRHHVGWILPFSFFAHFYFVPKPSSCHLQPPPPPGLSRLPPTPFPSLPHFPFRMANVIVGVLDPVPGGCWPRAGAVPTRAALGETPQPLCVLVWAPRPSRYSPLGLRGFTCPVSQLSGDSVMLCSGRHATALGTVCHHRRDRLALPWARQDHTPRMARPAQAGPAAPGDEGTPPCQAALQEGRGEQGTAEDIPGQGPWVGHR